MAGQMRSKMYPAAKSLGDSRRLYYSAIAPNPLVTGDEITECFDYAASGWFFP